MITFIELNGFSKRRKELLTDECFRLMQEALIVNPEAGRRIEGTGGFRKLRWALPGMGKSGGVRVIYYSLVPKTGRLYLAVIYAKNEQDTLTDTQKAMLKALTDKLV
ncbi:type II toxin-antitoxin system RelE/ParE family toxin [Marinobacterium weihaiense]|uniref:Type II toxin-antitoxin system RelE/ParE family toxin n=1 Tax=Marinobacterium weihaiense TaxID=2851016 RepID=A0ABS6MDU4_9GAMM|nr:type II toxin-antitoxin system RelE/ParE family toxin [Marinobacterium weihaiense]MBV0934405.1 type II toxin-antitoxin system RelE/ParE family toxin [Marinobacterium weihaiense]